MFGLMSESNLPTWFSSVLLLSAAVLLALIGVQRRRENQRDHYYWSGMSLVFLAMSLDETAMIHERINALLLLLGADKSGSLMTFPWVLPGVIAVLVFGIVFFRFFLTLPGRIKKLFALAGTVYIGGSLLMEVAEGIVFRNTAHQEGALQHAVACIQESMEIAGIAIFVLALLDYLVNHAPHWAGALTAADKD